MGIEIIEEFKIIENSRHQIGLSRCINKGEHKMNCLTCYNCVVKVSDLYLHCKAGMWEMGDGSKKFVKLGVKEVVDFNIHSRKILHPYNCQNFDGD